MTLQMPVDSFIPSDPTTVSQYYYQEMQSLIEGTGHIQAGYHLGDQFEHDVTNPSADIIQSDGADIDVRVRA